MPNTPSLSERAKFYWTCISPFSTKLLAGYAVVAFLTWIRDEFLPPEYKYRISDLLPAWPGYLWIAIGMSILVIALAEGLLRERHLSEAARLHSRPLIDVHGSPYGSHTKRGASRFIAPGVIVAIIMGAYFFLPQEVKKHESTLPSSSDSAADTKTTRPPETQTAIYMECNMASLPIAIPAHTAIHLIPLNKKRMQSVKWGFSDVINDSNLESQWPDKAVMAKARKTHSIGLNIWRCEISNHGTLTVLQIGMPINLWFGNEKPEVTYKAIIAPLDAGAKFTFYPVNDCSETVAAVWPDTVKLQVLGESHSREVPLRRTFKNPVEQSMMFFGTTTRLVGDHPCE